MKRLLLLACVLTLIAVPVAEAAKITVSAVSNGDTIDLTICGTGHRAVEVRVIDPSGNVAVGQAQARGLDCFNFNGWEVSESGTYTVEVGNLQGNNTFASTTVSAP